MQTLTTAQRNTLNSILSGGSYIAEWKAIINSHTYLNDEIRDISVTIPMISDFSIGLSTSAQLDIVIKPYNTIPKNAQITLSVRLSSSTQTSAWISCGTYFIDTREDAYNGCLSITAFDAMEKANYTFKDKTEIETYPASESDVVAEICTNIGVTLDSRTTLSSSAIVEYTNELTAREVLSAIAACHGGSFVITQQNKLRLVPFSGNSDSYTIGLNCQGLDVEKAYNSITGLRLFYSDNNAFVSGAETGAVIEGDCYFATQALATQAYNVLSGYTYKPYSAELARADPTLEVGDKVVINSVSYVAGNITWHSNGRADFSSPTSETAESESEYNGTLSRALSRKIELGTDYYGNSISRDEGFVTERISNGTVVARGVFNADTLSLQRLNNGVWQDCLYYDTTENKFVLSVGGTSSPAVDELSGEVSELDTAVSQLYVDTTAITARVSSAESNITTIQASLDGFTLSYNTSSKKVKLLRGGVSQDEITLSNLVDDDTLDTTLDNYTTETDVRAEIAGNINAITISYEASTKTVSLSNGKSTGTMDVVDSSTLSSSISAGINGISLDVTNGTSSSTLKLKSGSTVLSSKTIQFTGDVIFAADLTDGTTTISGSNILTGTIKADYIHLYDKMTVYSGSTGSTVGGYFGYTTSNVDSSYGVALKAATANRGECIATNLGARISYNGTQSQIYAISSGAYLSYSNSTNASSVYAYSSYVTAYAKEGSYTASYEFRYWGIRPITDNKRSLGESTHRWSVVYSGTPTISTSDRTQKVGISYDLSRYDSLFDALRPASYRFIDGTSGRTHTGLIAQDIESSLTACGLSTFDLAAFCRDDTETGTQYGLRYEEFIALCIRQIQTLKARVSALEANT